MNTLAKLRANFPMRRPNKEPEWSNLCDDVFDQFIDSTDPFGLDRDGHQRSSSDDSANLFHFSGASEQSHQTDATSPIPALSARVTSIADLSAEHPKAKGSAGFWAKTVRSLEQTAADREARQQILRSTRSHPDFLAVPDHPPPPAIPPSPTNESCSAQRRASRSTANGHRRAPAVRSVSRGRPAGVVKSTSTLAHATARRCSASPPKMMDGPHVRAPFMDFDAERVPPMPKQYQMLQLQSSNVPMGSLPATRVRQQHPAALQSPGQQYAWSDYDEQLSPLTSTFRQAHINTPNESPTINPAAYAANSSLDIGYSHMARPQLVRKTHSSSDNPYHTNHSSLLGANRIQAFDFGFEHATDPGLWASPDTHQAEFMHPHFPHQQNFTDVGPAVYSQEPSTEQHGLGIQADALQPQLLPHGLLPYHTDDGRHSPPATFDPVLTPRRVRASATQPLQSPTAPPGPESRARRVPSPRKASRHRRAKSATSSPRHSQHMDAAAVAGGFVNFTPHDKSAILKGVAPSGSSKTKARREKEAAEKRRRLSAAAVRAVVEAGGDLNALEEAGVLDEPESSEEIDAGMFHHA